MSSELAQWNPGQFKDKVENKIRETFVDLIPPEVFKEMVQKSIENFTTGRMVDSSSGYGAHQKTSQQYVPSGMERIVEDILKDEVRRAIQRELAKEEWESLYGAEIGEKVSTVVKKAAPQFIEGWLTEIVGRILESMKNTGY